LQNDLINTFCEMKSFGVAERRGRADHHGRGQILALTVFYAPYSLGSLLCSESSLAVKQLTAKQLTAFEATHCKATHCIVKQLTVL